MGREAGGRWKVLTADNKYLSVQPCNIYFYGCQWDRFAPAAESAQAFVAMLGLPEIVENCQAFAARAVAPFCELGEDVGAGFLGMVKAFHGQMSGFGGQNGAGGQHGRVLHPNPSFGKSNTFSIIVVLSSSSSVCSDVMTANDICAETLD